MYHPSVHISWSIPSWFSVTVTLYTSSLQTERNPKGNFQRPKGKSVSLTRYDEFSVHKTSPFRLGFCSSELSLQSSCPSNRSIFEIHRPFAHLNWSFLHSGKLCQNIKWNSIQFEFINVLHLMKNVTENWMFISGEEIRFFFSKLWMWAYHNYPVHQIGLHSHRFHCTSAIIQFQFFTRSNWHFKPQGF